ncbi:MAG: hypothetical protein LIO70_06855 [Clostridiales bacterium]|nr:hypothetical protein [Clostridiales bacterium]
MDEVKINAHMELDGIDTAMQKASQLCELIKAANALISELAASMAGLGFNVEVEL